MITGLLFDLFQGLCRLIQMLIGLLFLAIDNVFKVDQFGISMSTFKNILGGDISRDTGHVISWTAGSARFDALLNIMRNVGFFSGLIIFAFSFFLLLVKGLHETKDTVFSLVARMLIVAVLAGASPYIAAGFSDIGDQFYSNINSALINKVFDKNYADTVMSDNKDYQQAKTKRNLPFIGQIQQDVNDYKDADSKSSDSDTSAEVSDDKKKEAAANLVGTISAGAAVDIFVGTFPATGAFLLFITILVLVIRIIYMLIVLYNYLKLVIELIRRYMAYAVTYLMFPAVVGTLASGATSQIFWTWLRSLVSSMIALIITHLWLFLTKVIYNNLPMDLLGTFVIVAFISIGLNIEQFMRDRGFTMSAAGGRLLDSMVSSAFMLTNALRTGTQLTGNVLGGAAGLTGNMRMMQAANFLNGRGPGIGEAAKRMNDSVMSKPRKAMQNAMKNVSEGSKRAVVADAVQGLFNGGDRDMTSLQSTAFQAIANDDLQALNEAFDAMSDSERAEFAAQAAGLVMDDRKLFPEMLDAMNTDDRNAFIESNAMKAMSDGNMQALNTMLGKASQDTVDSVLSGNLGKEAVTAGNMNALNAMLDKASPEAIDSAVSNGLASQAVVTGNMNALNAMLDKASPETIDSLATNGLAKEALASGNQNALNSVLSKTSQGAVDNIATSGLAKEALNSGNVKGLNTIMGHMSAGAQGALIRDLATDSYRESNSRALGTMMSGMTGEEKLSFARSVGQSVTSGSGEGGFRTVTGLGNMEPSGSADGRGVFMANTGTGERQAMGTGGINITGMDGRGNLMGEIETPIGTTRMSITSAPTERGSNIEFTAGDGSTKFLQTGDTTPNTVAMSKVGGVNLSAFGDSLPSDNSSPVTYQTKFNSSTIQSFATSIGKDLADNGATNFDTQDAAHYTYSMVKNNRGIEEPTITATYGKQTYAIHQRNNGTIYATGFRDDVSEKLNQANFNGANANRGNNAWAKQMPKPKSKKTGHSGRTSD